MKIRLLLSILRIPVLKGYNIFRFMEGYGYIEDWQKWKDYYQKRNNTAHEYNLEKSRELVCLIPDFLSDVEFLINSIKERQNED